MPKRTRDMLIESGIIPENAVRQFEQHRVLPEGTANKVGSRPISLDRSSLEAERFVSDLDNALERESGELRETALEQDGSYREVYLQWGPNTLDPFSTTVVVDKLNRLHIPARLFGPGHRKKLHGVAFEPDYSKIRRVVKVEPLHTGEAVTAFVIHLERHR